MLRPLIPLATALAVIAVLPQPAPSQEACGFLAPFDAAARAGMGEAPAGSGGLAGGAAMELWLADGDDDGGRRWTLVTVVGDGRRCVAAAGHDWQGGAALR